MNEQTKEVKKADLITFDNPLVQGGSIQISKENIIKHLDKETRSYANFSFTVNGKKTFNIKELPQYKGKGVKFGIVFHLADNASGDKQTKEVMDI